MTESELKDCQKKKEYLKTLMKKGREKTEMREGKEAREQIYNENEIKELKQDYDPDLNDLYFTDNREEKDVYTDRALALFYSNDKNLKIKGKLNYRVKWCHDVITEKLWQEIQKEGWSKQLKDLIEFKAEDNTPEKRTNTIMDAIVAFDKELPSFKFIDSDFRKILGKKRLTGQQIKDLFEEYKLVNLNGTVRMYYAGGEEDYLTNYLHNDPLCYVNIYKTKHVTKRGKKPIWGYHIKMNLIGFILYSNLVQHKFLGLSKEFYKLRGGEQDIYRSLAIFTKKNYKFNELLNILNLKKDVKDIWKQKKSIEDYLNGLKKKGWIKSWKKDRKKGIDTVYYLKKK